MSKRRMTHTNANGASGDDGRFGGDRVRVPHHTWTWMHGCKSAISLTRSDHGGGFYNYTIIKH